MFSIISFSELNWTCLQTLFTVKASQVLVPGKLFEQLIGNFATNSRNYDKYYVWIFENSVLPNDIKINRNIYSVFFPSTHLHSFLFFVPLLHGLEAAFRSWEIKVHMGYLAQIIDTIFINPVI